MVVSSTIENSGNELVQKARLFRPPLMPFIVDNKQLQFQNALKHIGFTVKLKPYIQRSDGSAKGDWDVGITIDVMEMGKSVDTVILLSGDGDFDLLLKKIQTDYGVSTEVYGVRALTANSLIDAASIYHRIEGDLLLV